MFDDLAKRQLPTPGAFERVRLHALFFASGELRTLKTHITLMTQGEIGNNLEGSRGEGKKSSRINNGSLT